MRIYFEIFRLKRSHPERKGSRQLLKKNLAYFSIVFLTVLFILSNVQSKNQAKAATDSRVSKTIMASLVKNQFSSLSSEEELIEDSYMPDSTKINKQEKYYADAMIEKQSEIGSEESESASSPNLVLLNEDAMAEKPKNINFEEAGTQTSNQVDSTSSRPSASRNKVVDYTVQSGDTISSIASDFSITINTILWANNLASYSIIRPGDVLSIPPQSGVIHTVKSGDTVSHIASLYDVNEKTITENNNLGAILKIGEEIMVPGGTKISSRTVASASSKPSSSPNTGIAIIKDLVKPASSPQVSETTESGKMLWPTEGARITQYFSWSHTGLDIANKTGTPLYAAEGGTVTHSGWSNGYGYNVVIDHGGGKKTRYAHASKLYVEVGDEVERGETIAAMGSTGWSTGPHIHFEVIINGTKYNPLNYIK